MRLRLPIACQAGRQQGRLHSLITPSVLVAALVFSFETSNVVAASLRGHDMNQVKRHLAGDSYHYHYDHYYYKKSKVCNKSESFLGVGNTDCLHENLETTVFLLAVIVAVSIITQRIMILSRTAIKCPQLRLIVNRIFEEMMIMGVISMIVFILHTNDATLAFNDLTSYERLHFYEFFHYIVFLTMIYFIAIVLLLLFIGTVAPKLVWEIKHLPDQHRESWSDANEADAYGSQHPRFDNECNTHRMRHSFIRDVSSLSREINIQSMASTEDGTDVLGGEYYVSMHGQYLPDGAGTPGGRPRAMSSMDLAMCSRAYKLLLHRYQLGGWIYRINICKQWNLWKSFEILAYNICRNRSRYIYTNPIEMERLFGVRSMIWREYQEGIYTHRGNAADRSDNGMTYAKYHVLCMRNLLYHMTNIPPCAFVILIIICLLPSIFPDEDQYIFIGVGCMLLLLNVVIFFKVLSILRGIVDDRLRIISMQDIKERLAKGGASQGRFRRLTRRNQNRSTSESAVSMIHEESDEQGFDPSGEDDHNTLQTRSPKKFKAAALAVRAIIRMQMSALCHRQLHYHDNRFWFNSPKFLLRLFQFATIGQAFYLVWLSLVEVPNMADSSITNEEIAFLTIMIVLPFLSLFVITPLAMPSLVLVMSLTGIFVNLNVKYDDRDKRVTQEELKTHTRIMRRSFMRNRSMPFNFASSRGLAGTPCMPVPSPSQRGSVESPSDVFLHAYDSPASSFNLKPDDDGLYPLTSNRTMGFNHPVLTRNVSRSVCSPDDEPGEENIRNSRKTFDLAAFQSLGGTYFSATPTRDNDMDQQAPQQSTSFASTASFRSPRSSRLDSVASVFKTGRRQSNA